MCDGALGVEELLRVEERSYIVDSPTIAAIPVVTDCIDTREKT